MDESRTNMDSDEGSMDSQPCSDTNVADGASEEEDKDMDDFARIVTLSNQSRIGRDIQALSIAKIISLPVRGLLHNRDINLRHVADLYASFVKTGGPVREHMMLRACVDPIIANKKTLPNSPDKIDLRTQIESGHVAIYILSGRHRFEAGQRYAGRDGQVDMTVELFDLHTIDMKAALYVISRDNGVSSILTRFI